MANQLSKKNFNFAFGLTKTPGFTLVEALVALSISGMIITMTLFSWTFISRHTTIQKRKSMFFSQTETLASLIVNDLRTSPAILSINDHAITFVARINGDTVTYEFTGDSLRKNRIGVPLVAEGANVVQFSVEKRSVTTGDPIRKSLPGEKREDILLIITLGMQDRTGLTSLIPLQVKVRSPDEPTGGYGNNRWNF
jgi:prepilin-type N-terminal cleavage/methylation domain-containing protein